MTARLSATRARVALARAGVHTPVPPQTIRSGRFLVDADDGEGLEREAEEEGEGD